MRITLPSRTQLMGIRAKLPYWSKHPLFIPAATFMALFFFGVIMFILMQGKPAFASDSYLVVLSHDKKRETIPTRAGTVGELLQRSGVTLNEGDVVEPSADTPIREDNFRVNVYRARPVTIIDGGQKTFAFSAATTPRSVAQQAGVQLYPEDALKSEMQTSFLKDGAIGEKVVIDRATPANLNLYGTPVAVRTHAKTVGELLKEKKVVLGTGDQVQPAQDTPLTPQTQVFVLRNGTRIITSEEPIAMETETIEDPSLSFGTTAVRQQGSAGKRVVTYQIDLVNDKEVGRKAIQSVVAQEPVKHIIARGKAVNIPADKEALMAAAGISSSDYPYASYIINHENSLWCPTRWQGQNFCPSYYQEKYPGAESNTSLGYGMCQSTPANKMATAGEDWRTNAVTQLKWCASYAQRRHGGWQGAYNYWISHNNW